MGNSLKKILIIRLTSLGDVIFTIPLACTLKENVDTTQIGWLVAEKGLEIIKNNSCVDKVHFVPLKEWKKRPFAIKTFIEFIKLIREIRKEKYDVAIDCQQMFKNLFLFAFSGAKRRITFKDARELSILGGNEFITPKTKFNDYNYHVVERNLDFARYLGVEPKSINFSLPEISDETKKYVDDLLKNLDTAKPNVVIAPATTWPNKHWAEDNWAKVIENIHQNCNLIFTGTDSDFALLERILSKVNVDDLYYTNLLGKTNLEQLRELFMRSKIVLSPDSGSAHLAWASEIPAVITIFTCTPPMRFGPYDKVGGKYFSISGLRNDIKSKELYSQILCQPCFKKKCKLKKGKNVCQNYPKPDEIINIVNQLL